jgi:hypothetical protein
LNEEDLLFKFKNWIKANQAKLEVVLVWNYVNQELLAGDNAATVEHFREDNKLNLPVSLSCVHSWMLRVGCSYDAFKKTYYTDNHDRPDVVEDRVRYGEENVVFSKRKPLWAQLPREAVPGSIPADQRHDYIKEVRDEATGGTREVE